MGRIIEICGVDGSGKSTQADLLEQSLRDSGLSARQFGTPAGTPSGDAEMRRFQKSGETGLSFEALALNSAISRTIQYEFEVGPFVVNGGCAIFTRYIYSVHHYYMARGADIQFVDAVHSRLPAPTHAVLLHVGIEEARKRLVSRGNTLDFEERDDHYLAAIQDQMLAQWPRGKPVIDATQSVSAIASQILSYVHSP